MRLSNQGEIEEVFAIHTERIDLFAALVKGNEGKSVVHGRVRFEDGARLYFHYPEGNRVVIRNKLLSLCEAIADLYSTNVFCQRFDRAIECGEFIELLRSAKGSLN